jgi:TolB-like protein
VIGRCLQKYPRERFQSARDLAFDLRGLATARDADAEPGDSLAVVPFTNAGGPDAEYLSDGIAESLTNAFSQIPRLRIVPRSLVSRYKGREIDPRVVGAELGARMLLSGKVVERGGRLSVQVELVDAAANQQLWGERLHRPIADIFEVEEEITRQIVDKLRVRLSGDEQKQLVRRSTEDSEAYQLYLKARYHFLKRTAEGSELSGGMGIIQGALGHALVKGGRRQEAEDFVRELEHVSSTQYFEPYSFAVINVALGDIDRAFSWLEKAFQETSSWITLFLKSDPRMDVLRAEPRLDLLLRRMRLIS